jgi:hypothetical protein
VDNVVRFWQCEYLSGDVAVWTCGEVGYGSVDMRLLVGRCQDRSEGHAFWIC